MQRFVLFNTIQGLVLKNIIGSYIIGELLNGSNHEYMWELDQYLNFKEGVRELLLNEIKYKPSMFDLNKIFQYTRSRNLEDVLWINYYKENENDVNILNKELRHLRLFLKRVWDYEYYYFNKIEATIEILKTELHSIYLKSLFFNESEGSFVIYFFMGDILEIDLIKKKNIKEIKMNNLLKNLIRNGFINFRGIEERLKKKWKEEYWYVKMEGRYYGFIEGEREDLEEIERKKKNFNKQVERNVYWIKERIEEWREEWEVERREGGREFFKE
jgi:hypothetical protein